MHYNERTEPVGARTVLTTWLTLNTVRAKFAKADIKMYLQFILFLNTDMTQVDKTLPHVRQ